VHLGKADLKSDNDVKILIMHRLCWNKLSGKAKGMFSDLFKDHPKLAKIRNENPRSSNEMSL